MTIAETSLNYRYMLDNIADPSQSVAQTSPDDKTAKKPWLFSKANAKELQAKSVEARRIANLPKGNSDEEETQEPLDGFIEEMRQRTRDNCRRIMGLAEKETDPKPLDLLTRSVSTTLEAERQLSNRPLPGSLRPKSDSKKRRGGAR